MAIQPSMVDLGVLGAKALAQGPRPRRERAAMMAVGARGLTAVIVREAEDAEAEIPTKVVVPQATQAAAVDRLEDRVKLGVMAVRVR